MIRLSKIRYLITTAGCLALGSILIFIGDLLYDKGLVGIGDTLILIGFAIMTFSFVMWMLLIYRMWQSVQDGYARTTPAKAVGFLFIPFFNLYWIFQAWWGFAKDCNSYIKRNQATVQRLPEGLFLAVCILTVLALLCSPFFIVLIILPVLIAIIFGFFLVGRICDTINQLPQPILVVPQVEPPEFEERILTVEKTAPTKTEEVKEKRKLTRKQTLTLGIVVTIVVIATGIAAGSWFVLTIGIASLIYTLFIAMKKKE